MLNLNLCEIIWRKTGDWSINDLSSAYDVIFRLLYSYMQAYIQLHADYCRIEVSSIVYNDIYLTKFGRWMNILVSARLRGLRSIWFSVGCRPI